MTAEPEEHFDVVDENDNVLRQLSRSEVHRQKLIHRAVHIFVFRADGRLLIHKRPDHKVEFPSVWTSSASGHVSAGEHYDIAAVRELDEELGIKTTGVVNQKGRESLPAHHPTVTQHRPPEKDSRPFPTATSTANPSTNASGVSLPLQPRPPAAPSAAPLPYLERLHKFPPSPATCNEHTVLYRTITEQELTTDPYEIEAIEWVELEHLAHQRKETPEKYSPAFRLLFDWYTTNEWQSLD